jgi:hypothetical protein
MHDAMEKEFGKVRDGVYVGVKLKRVMETAGSNGSITTKGDESDDDDDIILQVD